MTTEGTAGATTSESSQKSSGELQDKEARDSQQGPASARVAAISGDLPGLQQRKLELEIAELRQWWRRPQFISSFFPAVVAVVGLASAVYVGYFDKAKIDLEKTYLQQQIDSIQSTRASLEREIESLRGKEAALTQRIGTLNAARSEESEYSSRAIVANKEFARANAELQRSIDSASSELEKLRSDLSREAQKTATAKAYADKLREELSLLPPFLTGGALLSSDSDARFYGGLFGANFEEEKGSIQIRIVRAKLLAGETAPASDRMKEQLLELEVEPKFVTEWSWRRLNFYLSPDNRSRVAALQKRLGKGQTSDPLDLGASVEFHGRVETAVGKISEWVVMTAYPPNTPEIR